MGASITKLRKPVTRKLDAHIRGRPWFIEIDPAGFITVWPRRGKHEPIHVEAVYVHAKRLRVDRERQRKKKGKL
jgi:hypothetical protein